MSDRCWFLCALVVCSAWAALAENAIPRVAVELLALEFGVSDFRVALWLRRVDPILFRRRACVWIYIAAGLWKVAIAGTAMMTVISFLSEWARVAQAGADLFPMHVQAGLVALTGFALSAAATVPAIVMGLRHGIKIWAGPLVDHARRANLWPIPLDEIRGTNRAKPVIETALLFPGTILSSLALISLLVIVKDQIAVLRNSRDAVVLASVGLVGFSFVAMVVVSTWLKERVVAQAPWQCWDPDNPPDAWRDTQVAQIRENHDSEGE
jgi:hypothetical protein